MMSRACGVISTLRFFSLKPKGQAGEREERLITNRSNRPGDDVKDELRS